MFSLFGVPITNTNLAEALERIQGFLRDGQKHLVVTANPEMLLAARQNPAFRQVLQRASLVVPDGVGLVMASYALGEPLTKGRVTGVRLVEELVAKSGEYGYSVFLAGSTQEVLDKTTHYFGSRYNKINICGSYGPKTLANKSAGANPQEESVLVEKIQAAKPDILLLAWGHEKQELWLAQNMADLGIKVGVGVGGTFDYLSGTVSQAPAVLRKLGFEWLWRLLIQPRRLGRIVSAVVVFPALVLVEMVKKLFHVEQ